MTTLGIAGADLTLLQRLRAEVAQVRSELASAGEALQSASEELALINEELRSANAALEAISIELRQRTDDLNAVKIVIEAVRTCTHPGEAQPTAILRIDEIRAP